MHVCCCRHVYVYTTYQGANSRGQQFCSLDPVPETSRLHWAPLTLFRTGREDGKLDEADTAQQVSLQTPLWGLLMGASDSARQKRDHQEGRAHRTRLSRRGSASTGTA